MKEPATRDAIPGESPLCRPLMGLWDWLQRRLFHLGNIDAASSKGKTSGSAATSVGLNVR
jgi:hypothetical protein